MIQTIIVSLVFVTYIIYVLIRDKEVLPSISDSWYGGEWEFRYFLTILGITIMTHGGILFFISGMGLALTGFAGWFREDKIIGRIHYMGAVVGILFCFLGTYYYFDTSGVEIVIFSVISLLMKIIRLKNLIWWVEIFAFTVLMERWFNHFIVIN